MEVPTPPESESIAAIFKWVMAAVFAGIPAIGGAFMWLISKAATREEKMIEPMTESVDSMAESLGDLARAVDKNSEKVNEHLKKANQLEHDKQLLANSNRYDR